jgi:cell division protein FtsB
MQRNRKRESLRFGTVAKSIFACVSIAVVGLGYVWQKNQIYRLGDEIKRREVALMSLDKRNLMLNAQLAQLKSPGQLEARCQQYNLGLVAPREAQMVRLYEPGAAWDVQLAKVLPVQIPNRAPAAATTRRVVAQR